MTLLFSYLLRQFFRNILLVFACFMTVYFLIDFFEKIDDFLEASLPVSLVLQYFFWKTPLVVEQLTPIAVLLGGILTFGILQFNREYVSLLTGGISLIRIVRPLLAGAILVSLGILAMSQWVKPPATALANRIWHELVRHEKPRGTERQGRTYYQGREGLYTFVRAGERTDAFSSFIYLEWDEARRPRLLVSAAAASWREGVWRLEEATVKRLQPDGSFAVAYESEKEMPLPDSPAEFFVPVYRLEELSLSQLFARARQSSEALPQAWLDLNGRLSYILLGLPLLLLGLPVLLAASARWGRDLSLTIPISCGLAFLAWGWWGAAQSLARTFDAGPFLASWSIHGLTGGLGAFLLKRKNG